MGDPARRASEAARPRGATHTVPPTAPERPKAVLRAGFTLIELMAVVLIAGLLLALVVPGLSTTRIATLRAAAREMAAHIELARQRAVMTSAPHRVLIDLEAGAYRIEWWVTEARANGLTEAPSPPAEEPSTDPADYLNPGQIEVSLSPPASETSEFHAIPTTAGRFAYLDDRLFFEGVDTAEGWLDGGEVEIVFDWDGTTDASEVVISDIDDHTMRLEVRPLLDMVRIVEESSEDGL